jgi:hypothetical protein
LRDDTEVNPPGTLIFAFKRTPSGPVELEDRASSLAFEEANQNSPGIAVASRAVVRPQPYKWRILATDNRI